MKMAIAEVDTNYKERPPGSASKLRTFRDGWRILVTIMNLMRNERPLLFFSLIGMACILGSIVLGWPVFHEYLRNGKVPRFPTAVLWRFLGVTTAGGIATR